MGNYGIVYDFFLRVGFFCGGFWKADGLRVGSSLTTLPRPCLSVFAFAFGCHDIGSGCPEYVGLSSGSG